jgi:hypothetical protein
MRNSTSMLGAFAQADIFEPGTLKVRFNKQTSANDFIRVSGSCQTNDIDLENGKMGSIVDFVQRMQDQIDRIVGGVAPRIPAPMFGSQRGASGTAPTIVLQISPQIHIHGAGADGSAFGLANPDQGIPSGHVPPTSRFRLWGFIGAPGVSRGTRDEQHLFVNQRPVDNRGLNFALLEGYHTALMRGRYPGRFLKNSRSAVMKPVLGLKLGEAFHLIPILEDFLHDLR